MMNFAWNLNSLKFHSQKEIMLLLFPCDLTFLQFLELSHLHGLARWLFLLFKNNLNGKVTDLNTIMEEWKYFKLWMKFKYEIYFIVSETFKYKQTLTIWKLTELKWLNQI